MDRLPELKAQLDALRPLPPEHIRLLWPQWRAEDALFVYATNALEGSTLTLAETIVVLEKGVTVGGKSVTARTVLGCLENGSPRHRRRRRENVITAFDDRSLA
jgi:hypothetical protein